MEKLADRAGSGLPFFPEGGGQYADTGILGSARVLDVQEKDGVIFHRTDAPLSVGDCVEGRIDWDLVYEDAAAYRRAYRFRVGS